LAGKSFFPETPVTNKRTGQHPGLDRKGGRVSAILTLVFVCNPAEVCSPFLAPLRAAAPRLLVEHRTADMKVLLSRELVDVIGYTDARHRALLF